MASIVNYMRRISGRGTEEPTSPQSVQSPREGNPWRGVFDPASNPKNVGRSYYDCPDPNQPAKTTWDYHLDAQKSAASDLTQAAFQAMGAKSTDDVLDSASLRKMFEADRVAKIMEAADKNKDGKISYKEFCEMIRKHPCE